MPSAKLSNDGTAATSLTSANAHCAGSPPDDFEARLAGNRALFPLGVDLLLVAGNELAALPRTTVVARA